MAKTNGAKKRLVKKAKPKGRPSAYRPEFPEQAEKLCRLGASDKEMALFFNVSERTLNTWKISHPDFLQSLKRGKELSDTEVADRLFNRAIGYSHPDVHISNYQGLVTITPITKHYPPDTVACIFWLKNRRPDLWRDKVTQEISGPNGGPIVTATKADDLTDDQLAAIAAGSR
jgi:hypothetical protein